MSKLINKALQGKEVIIARGNQPVVRLDVIPGARSRRKIGNAKSLTLSMPDDFDEPLDDFKDYMG